MLKPRHPGFCLAARLYLKTNTGAWGEGLFIFRKLGSTGNYFQGFGEQIHSLGGFGEPCKKVKKKYKISP